MNVEIPDEIVRAINERTPDREAGDALESALRIWLDITDGRGVRGGALAILLDEIGSSARGELALPDREQLADWLGLLNRIASINLQ